MEKSLEADPRITIYGTPKEIEEAEVALKTIPDLADLKESEARLKIQDLIDSKGLKADILFKGNRVWSMNRIIRNLRQIINHGTLYDKKKPRFIPIGSMLRMPAIGDTVLSKYFYEFLHLCCGSIAHYDIRGWVAKYPTVEDLRRFFRKNEYGKRVLDDIPWWKTDAKRIVERIEALLFPFESYMKTRR